jgi:hypothetical protein
VIQIVDDKILCPYCGECASMLRISRAARMADVSRRTVYSYVESGSVFSLRVAGKTLRVCANCLFNQKEDGASAPKAGIGPSRARGHNSEPPIKPNPLPARSQ